MAYKHIRLNMPMTAGKHHLQQTLSEEEMSIRLLQYKHEHIQIWSKINTKKLLWYISNPLVVKEKHYT